MTITIGWWAIPLIITIVAFGWASYETGREPKSGYFVGLTSLFTYGAALIVTLFVWLVWALVR